MYRFLLSLSFLSCLTFVFPQKITFEFDYAQFGYESLSNYVEFYYSFNQLGLTYVDTDTVDYVQGLLQIQIDDSITSTNIIDKHWIISNEITDSAGFDRSLIGMVGFVIDKGSYIVHVTGSDANNPLNKKTINEQIYVNPFLNSNIALSDVQLASNIVHAVLQYAEQGEHAKARELILRTEKGDLHTVVNLFAEARTAFREAHKEVAIVLTDGRKHLSLTVDRVACRLRRLPRTR